MESSKVTRPDGAEWKVMAPPLTWDRHTPAPGSSLQDTQGTEPSPTFDASELDVGDVFEGESEKTVITAVTPYDLRPKFTGRADAIQQLQELTERACEKTELGFAVVVAEPGMGKSRLLGEVIACAKSKF